MHLGDSQQFSGELKCGRRCSKSLQKPRRVNNSQRDSIVAA